ncbi:MAG: tRNA pseudouridine synthase B [Wolbachia endosymbiont of Ctenocephalides orientis wCori]|nr:MAG: tRNA pseudouridine synthase B [Wolbachia endosymbiont of Ctenocephalides orientis wCori]
MTHGWLNLDKPIGISSTQAVTRIKKIFGVKKAGHLGTLDPLATGVLPIALGEATKTIPYLSCNLKAYDFTVKWGEQRTTDDLDGEIIKTSSVKPEYNQIDCAMKNFIGKKIIQTPPQFSAIKINGVRSYKLARRGQNVNIKPRIVQIHELKLISVNFENNSADFSTVCGDGVYVRSVARDLGTALNCFGYVAKLRRTMVGNFKEVETITIDQLTQKGNIIPITSILEPMLKIEISLEDAREIRNGKEITLNYLRNFENHDICCVVVGSVPIAICSFIYGCVKPIRVFNICCEV